MKSSIARKAGRVFLSTATGLCFLQAEPGLSQDTPAAPAIMDAPLLLEPPRPAIRQTETEPAPTVEVLAEPAPEPPVISPDIPKKVAPPVAASRQKAIPEHQEPALITPRNPKVVPRPLVRSAARSITPGLTITPGPSTNPALNKPAVPIRPVQPRKETQRPQGNFEMPILSVPMPQTVEPEPIASGPSFGTSAQEICLDGCCPVTLRDARQRIPGRAEYTAEWQGTVYRMATPQAHQRFEARPAHYAPANGGRDVILASDKGKNVQGSLEHAAWYRRQLYLFQDETTLKNFQACPEKYIGK